MKSLIFIALFLISSTFAGQACFQIDGSDGLWINIDGNNYPCALTTRYWETTMGSCGCGTGDGEGNVFDWQWNTLTAASNAPLFGQDSWCGSGCGSCYMITPTGGFVDGEGSAPYVMDSQAIMITNLCPADDANARNCASPNAFGYSTHFDLFNYYQGGIVYSLG